MQTTQLGRTGLTVSVAGLGGGGHSRLGRARGASTAESVAIVHRALDLGINFIDTSAAYGTEPIVGAALKGRRGDVVISTKTPYRDRSGKMLAAADIVAACEASLKRLETDYIDIYNLHGVGADDYAYCRENLVPGMRQLQERGKIRFLGITERFSRDTAHAMLQTALPDGCWDVVMVGFNLLNPSARDRVFVRTRRDRIGTQIMFAVRRALSRPDALRALVDDLAEGGGVAWRDCA